jgi:hypothetical protein
MNEKDIIVEGTSDSNKLSQNTVIIVFFFFFILTNFFFMLRFQI